MCIRTHPNGCGRMHIIDYRNHNSIYSVQQTQDKYQIFFGISGIFVFICSFKSNNVRKRVTALLTDTLCQLLHFFVVLNIERMPFKGLQFFNWQMTIWQI